VILGIEFYLSCIFFDDSKANNFRVDCLLGSGLAIEFVNGFELDVKRKLCLVEVFRLVLVGLKDS
jgi:hypothetical protein